MFNFLIIILLLHKVSGAPSELINKKLLIKKVFYGDTVLLQCKSNDENYNFDYWLYNNRKIVIGPSNPYDTLKYRYEILSGNLTVRAVTKSDEGLYSCISKAVRAENVKVEQINVIVEQNWNQINEHDTRVNTVRILIALIVLVIVGFGAYTFYNIWKNRYLYPTYLEQSEDDDEDSGEEIFSAPGPSHAGNKPDAPFSNMSTDFKSILETTNDK